jgi:hypothetical protein
VDFKVRDEGTIVLFQAVTADARAWWADNVEDGMTFGGACVVEHRYADAIISGIVDAGFVVRAS